MLMLTLLAHQITHIHFKTVPLKVLLQLKNKEFTTQHDYEPEEKRVSRYALVKWGD